MKKNDLGEAESPVIISFNVIQILQLLQANVMIDESGGGFRFREDQSVGTQDTEDTNAAVFLEYDGVFREVYLRIPGGHKAKDIENRVPPIQLQRSSYAVDELFDMLAKCAHYERGVNCGFVYTLPRQDVAEIARSSFNYLVIEVFRKNIRYYGAGIPGGKFLAGLLQSSRPGVSR